MDRRQFMQLSAAGLLGLTVGGQISLEAKRMRKNGDYSIVILGDTHFDTEPVDVYHSNYNEPVEWLNCVQREEFRRNGEMWRERCPRLLNNAARLIDRKTRMVFQMGDLIQGDCGKREVHQKMLSDVMNHFKGVLGCLPFVTVCGIVGILSFVECSTYLFIFFEEESYAIYHLVGEFVDFFVILSLGKLWLGFLQS